MTPSSLVLALLKHDDSSPTRERRVACLVLEKHYEAGGYTHVFKRKGYEWDVGVHYIGEG